MSTESVEEHDPARRLQEMADVITPMCLRVAATLHIADFVEAGASTAARLAERCGAQPDALRRLLQHLAAIGVLTLAPAQGSGEDEFRLTELGRGLLSTDPAGLRAGLDIRGPVGRGELAALRLLDTVLTGQPAYPLVYGRTFWEDLAADKAMGAVFDELMGAHDPAPTVGGYPWETLAEVVDAGGGNGTVLAALLEAYPHLRGTLVDLPGPAEAARRLFAERGLAERTTVIAGSFFDPLPPGASAYLLSRLIHDWNDEDARRILRRCAEAAGTTGRVLVVDSVLEGTENAGGTQADLFMLLLIGGRERTLAEFEGLGAAAGLTLRQVRPAGPRYLLEYVRQTVRPLPGFNSRPARSPE